MKRPLISWLNRSVDQILPIFQLHRLSPGHL
jgi:hypothetical protein